ncbi:MAG: hypothetical protein DPW16_18110 [Chloroflexi bacterium]|nr:hypothetical protein [Chloroflexota bacterium]
MSSKNASNLALVAIFLIYATALWQKPDAIKNPQLMPTPTSLVAPTLEPGIPQITILDPHIHGTGLFQFFQPGDDWYLERDDYNPDYQRASTIYISPSRLSVIHAFIEIGVTYYSLQEVNDLSYTDSFFNVEWGQFKSWRITNWQVTDDLITIEFALEDGRNELLKYIARQISWLEDDWLYTIRIVVPDNNQILLDQLFELASPTMIGYQNIGTLPLVGWHQFSDQSHRVMIKLPNDSRRISGSSGQPMTYVTSAIGDGRITIQRIANQSITSLDAVQTFLDTIYDDVTIIDSHLIEQAFATGYQVTYVYKTLSGDLVKVLAVLLNDTEGNLYLAELSIPEQGSKNLTQQMIVERQIIRSFTVLAPPEYKQPLFNQ